MAWVHSEPPSGRQPPKCDACFNCRYFLLWIYGRRCHFISTYWRLFVICFIALPHNENMTAAKTISAVLLGSLVSRRSLVLTKVQLPGGGGARWLKITDRHHNLGQLRVEQGTRMGPTAIVDRWWFMSTETTIWVGAQQRSFHWLSYAVFEL